MLIAPLIELPSLPPVDAQLAATPEGAHEFLNVVNALVSKSVQKAIPVDPPKLVEEPEAGADESDLPTPIVAASPAPEPSVDIPREAEPELLPILPASSLTSLQDKVPAAREERVMGAGSGEVPSKGGHAVTSAQPLQGKIDAVLPSGLVEHDMSPIEMRDTKERPGKPGVAAGTTAQFAISGESIAPGEMAKFTVPLKNPLNLTDMAAGAMLERGGHEVGGLVSPQGGGDLAGARTIAPPLQVAPAQTNTALQIARQIRDGIEGSTEIRLDPPELGRLRFVVTGGEAGLHLVLHAEQPDTAELLRRHLEVLAQELRQAGYGAVDVALGDRPRDGPAPDNPLPQAAAGSQKAVVLVRTGTQGLDLRL